MHNGVRDTLVELRSNFWVVKGRQTVQSIISKCATCKKIEGRCFKIPPSPHLPEFRVSDEFAFTRIGVDFAGPIFVKDIYGSSKKMHKAYIALYTCASSRGIHLETVPDLSADSFINSLIRFKARRGNPLLVLSDNGKTFKDSKLKAYCLREAIQWKFNVETSPWWGGFFERLVRSVKKCLKKSLRTARVNYEELSTILIQIEGVLNSRPLAYVYEEMDEPLTPSHLMIGRRILSKPPVTPRVREIETSVQLSRRTRFLQKRMEHFWSRWRSEYLTELREYHRASGRSNSNRSIQLGDVVCVEEKKTPRQFWRLGKVEKLLRGRDGQVRSAVIRVKSGDQGTTELKRPVQRLYPLEVTSPSRVENTEQSAENVPIRMVTDEMVPVVLNR